MSDEAQKQSKVGQLKNLLLDTLTSQIENGVTVIDKEGGEHVVDVGAPVLAVAAKVVKDWADDMKADAHEKEQIDRLSTFLNRRRPDLTTEPKPN